MKRYYPVIAALTLCTATLLPVQAMAQVNLSITIGNAPPPVRYESVPAPRAGYIWAPGYWDWNGHDHVWRDGHWEHARRGYVYSRPQWREDHGKWKLYKGGWQQRHDEHRDKHQERHYDKHDDRRHDRDHCPPGQAKKGNC